MVNRSQVFMLYTAWSSNGKSQMTSFMAAEMEETGRGVQREGLGVGGWVVKKGEIIQPFNPTHPFFLTKSNYQTWLNRVMCLSKKKKSVWCIMKGNWDFKWLSYPRVSSPSAVILQQMVCHDLSSLANSELWLGYC